MPDLIQELLPNQRGTRLEDGKGNFLGYENVYEVSDEELLIEQIETETEEANDQALWAYTNFDSLNDAQRKKVLKGLLGDFISRNRGNYM